MLDTFATSEAAEYSSQSMSLRQAEWDRQLESVDQKQAELLAIQWKLVREQTGTLARELAFAQQQLKDLKVDSRRAVLDVERSFRENEGKINEERGLRLAMYESLEQRVKKMKHDIESEATSRAAGDAEFPPRLEAITAAVNVRAQDHAALDLEVRKLQEVLRAVTEELDAVKEAVSQEASERNAGEEGIMDLLHGIREALSKETRDRIAATETLGHSLQQMIEQERADWMEAKSAIHKQHAALERDVQGHAGGLPALRSSLLELEATLGSRLDDARKSLEHELGERAAVHQKFDRRLADLSIMVDREAAARRATAEEQEQAFKTLQSKFKNSLAEQVDSARLAREELQSQLSEDIEKEIANRESQHAAVMEQVSGQRAVFDVRFDTLSGNFRDLEQRNRDERQEECCSREADHAKLSEELAGQVRELRDSLGARFAEERAAREAGDASLEEQVGFLDRFLQDVRELFLQRSSRHRQLAARKAAGGLLQLPPTPRGGGAAPAGLLQLPPTPRGGGAAAPAGLLQHAAPPLATTTTPSTPRS